jgi:hypothetical protein
LLLAAAVGGCAAEVTVRQYPPFYDPELKSVAVVPFANDTLRARAGEFLANRVAAALKANGTYTVAGPRELKARLRSAGVSLPDEPDASTAAAALRRLGGIQAFVTGRVTALSADRVSYVGFDNSFYWGYGRWHRRYRHGFGLGLGYGYRPYTRTQACAAAEAALIRVADGSTIHATAAPVGARISSWDEPPKLADEALAEAADAVARGIVRAFAVVPRKLRLDVDKTLRTARRTEGGELKFTDDFRAAEKEMVVALRLPAPARRNPFRLAIAKRSVDQPLVEREFVWSAKDAEREFVFSPSKLAEAAGPGHFEARLHSGPQLVLKRGFEIEQK